MEWLSTALRLTAWPTPMSAYVSYHLEKGKIKCRCSMKTKIFYFQTERALSLSYTQYCSTVKIEKDARLFS